MSVGCFSDVCLYCYVCCLLSKSTFKPFGLAWAEVSPWDSPGMWDGYFSGILEMVRRWIFRWSVGRNIALPFFLGVHHLARQRSLRKQKIVGICAEFARCGMRTVCPGMNLMTSGRTGVRLALDSAWPWNWGGRREVVIFLDLEWFLQGGIKSI